MPKTLYVVRHADASLAGPGQDDFDRVLSQTGLQEAQHMASWFASTFACPDFWLSSSAPRARATAEVFASEFKIATVIQTEGSIYEAPYQRLLNALQNIGDDHQSAIMFGHNPGVSYLVQALSQQSVGFATGNVAQLECKIDNWGDLGLSVCELCSFTQA